MSDDSLGRVDVGGFDDPPGGKPAGFKLPQIIVEGILRKSRKAEVITFKLRLLRLIELTFIVTVPREGATRAPVYIRFFVDRSKEDRPGTVIIE